MPNWCSNKNIFWTSESYFTEVNDFLDFCWTTLDDPDRPGYLRRPARVADLLTAKGVTDIPCAGSVSSIDSMIRGFGNKIGFTLETYTPWGPEPETLKALLKDYPHLHLAYLAEKPNLGVFLTNDKNSRFFKKSWKISVMVCDKGGDRRKALRLAYPNLPEDGIYHATEDEARTFFTTCFGVDCEKESPKHLMARGLALQKRIREAFPDLDYVYVDFQHIQRI